MQHFVHRGRHEIGGMCIEVRAEDGTRVLLDLGMPLYDDDRRDYAPGTAGRSTRELIEAGVLRDIPGLYAVDTDAPRFAAIIVTHAHLDHYGLAHHAHPDIPVYASPGTLALLDVRRVFFPDAPLPPDLRPLPDGEPLRFGGLTVTAVPVDHSAPDARALLVEADGKRLLYSGDLRAHGRTGWRFDAMLEDERLHGVDVLLLEGTTLGRAGGSHGLASERDVEESLVRLADSHPGLVAVVASGQNLDRLVSCFRAAKRTGRQLVVDPYQAYVLLKLSALSQRIPQFTWSDVRVKFVGGHVQRLKDAGLFELACEMSWQAKVTTLEIVDAPARFLLVGRGSSATARLLGKLPPEDVALVWSMWRGYWDREPNAMRSWSERAGVEPRFVHSGGHAWEPDLRRLQERLQPKRVEWVHTEAS